VGGPPNADEHNGAQPGATAPGAPRGPEVAPAPTAASPTADEAEPADQVAAPPTLPPEPAHPPEAPLPPGVVPSAQPASEVAPHSGLAAPAGPDPTTPEHASEQVSEDAQWERWKGTIADVAEVLTAAKALIDKVQSEDESAYAGAIRVGLRARELTFKTVEAFERGMKNVDLDEVQTITYSGGYLQQRATLNIYIARWGTSFSVRGQDPCAVAGIAKELKSELDKGRRWTQFKLLRPGVLQPNVNWLALIGLAVATFIPGSWATAIGLVLVCIAGLGLAVSLVMTSIEPRLVPGLELLSEAKERTVAQTWAARAVKALAFVGVAVAGALINASTGLLF
jgi:hypothetical protein